MNKQSIFKFCDFETSLLILPNNELKLSTPGTFNDPYDTNVVLSAKELSKAKDLIINYALCEEFKKILFSESIKFKTWQKPFIYLRKWKYYRNQKRNCRRNEYKPPFNFIPVIWLLNKLKIRNGPLAKDNEDAFRKMSELIQNGNIQEDLKMRLITVPDSLLITCFSKTYDSILMWSHYSDNGRGVCIEFENEEFLDVNYSQNRKSFELTKIIRRIIWSFHNKNIPENQADNFPSQLGDILPYLIKSTAWRHEKEVRAIFNENSAKIVKHDGLSFYRMKKVLSITAGYRVSENNLKILSAFAKEKDVILYKMEISQTTFDLLRKEVKY